MLGEDLADEAEVASRDDVPVTVGRGDPGRLLAAVLQRVEREVRQARDRVSGGIDPENAAFVARTVPRIWAA